VIDRRGEQSFRLDMRGVGLEMLMAWLGRKETSGMLAGSPLARAGPAAAPTGTGTLRVDLAVGDRPAGTVLSNLAWNGTRLELGGGFATAEHDSLTWSGHLPLVVSLAAGDSVRDAHPVRILEGDVDVRLAASHFPLRAFSPFFDPRSTGTPDGTLDIDARLSGSGRNLVGNGHVDLAGGALPLPGIGVTYRDLELHAAFAGDSLVVSRAHAASGKGTFDATGRIRFVSAARIEPHLHVSAKRFTVVKTADLKSTASAELDLSGTFTQPVVRGKVSVENTDVTFKQSDLAAGAAAAAVPLSDADIRMMEESFGYVKTSAPAAGLAFYDASDLDLGVTLGGNCWLRQRVQPQMAVALTGQFRLRKAPHGEPELNGRIEPVPQRGYVEQFARNFDITGGDVLLNGKTKDHQVNIQAQYKPPSTSESNESEVTVQLAVQGTADNLKLTLSSEPAMSDAEIVNFIATGRSRVDPSTSGAQGSSLAKDVGLAQVSGVAESAAQQAIGLDVLQVRFDALQGATLVSGSYLNPKLYVGIRQPLQYKDSNTPTSSETYRTRYEVEYTIHRWLVFNLQGETSKLRSFFRARHAY
jgi:translocation and assembly module TamB